MSQKRTFHANAPYRGRFHSPGPNLPRKRRASWKVQHPERNHPRRGPKPWKVPFPRPEPSTKTPRIMEGSASRAEPSTLKPEIVEGSIPQTNSPDQFPRPIPQTHSAGPSPRPEPLRCLIQSLQFNIPVGMELTTSSARQDTAPLSMILPDKKPATPATFVTSAPVGAMDNPALSRALSGTAPGIADEHTVGFFWKFH